MYWIYIKNATKIYHFIFYWNKKKLTHVSNKSSHFMFVSIIIKGNKTSAVIKSKTKELLTRSVYDLISCILFTVHYIMLFFQNWIKKLMSLISGQESRRQSNASSVGLNDDDPLLKDCIGLRQRLLDTEKSLQNLTISTATPRVSPNNSLR